MLLHNIVIPSTDAKSATMYAGQVFYEQKWNGDLMRFIAAKDLNALQQVNNLT